MRKNERLEVPCRPTRPCPQRPRPTTPSPRRRSISLPRERRPGRAGRSNTAIPSPCSIGASAGDADGLFHNDTRFLSYLELLVNGEQPLLLGSNLRDDNTLLSIDLTNPDFFVDGRISMARTHRGSVKPVSDTGLHHASCAAAGIV